MLNLFLLPIVLSAFAVSGEPSSDPKPHIGWDASTDNPFPEIITTFGIRLAPDIQGTQIPASTVFLGIPKPNDSLNFLPSWDAPIICEDCELAIKLKLEPANHLFKDPEWYDWDNEVWYRDGITFLHGDPNHSLSDFALIEDEDEGEFYMKWTGDLVNFKQNGTCAWQTWTCVKAYPCQGKLTVNGQMLSSDEDDGMELMSGSGGTLTDMGDGYYRLIVDKTGDKADLYCDIDDTPDWTPAASIRIYDDRAPLGDDVYGYLHIWVRCTQCIPDDS